MMTQEIGDFRHSPYYVAEIETDLDASRPKPVQIV